MNSYSRGAVILAIFTGFIVFFLSSILALVMGESVWDALWFTLLFTLLLAVYLLLYNRRAEKKWGRIAAKLPDADMPRTLRGLLLRWQILYIIAPTDYKLKLYTYDPDCFGNVEVILERDGQWHRFVDDRGAGLFSVNKDRSETWTGYKTLYTSKDAQGYLYEPLLRAVTEFTGGNPVEMERFESLRWDGSVEALLYNGDFTRRAVTLRQEDGLVEVLLERYVPLSQDERERAKMQAVWEPDDRERHLFDDLCLARLFAGEALGLTLP